MKCFSFFPSSGFKIFRQPAPQLLIVPGEPASFTVIVARVVGDGILMFQWQKDGVDIPTQATSATYTISSVTENDEGEYRCVVSNATHTEVSDAANLTVCKCMCLVSAHTPILTLSVNIAEN